MCIRDRVSAALTGEIFIEPIIRRWLGKSESGQDEVTGSLTVSYTHLRAHETVLDFVCRLLLEKKKVFRLGIGCRPISLFVW